MAGSREAKAGGGLLRGFADVAILVAMAVVALAISAGLHLQSGLGFAMALVLGVVLFLVMATMQLASARVAPPASSDHSAQIAELQTIVGGFADKLDLIDRFAARSEEFDALSHRLRDMESINIRPNEIETLVLRVRQIDRLAAEIDRMDSRLEALRTQMQIDSRERHEQLSGELQELGALVQHLANNMAEEEEHRTRQIAGDHQAVLPQPAARLSPPVATSTYATSTYATSPDAAFDVGRQAGKDVAATARVPGAHRKPSSRPKPDDIARAAQFEPHISEDVGEEEAPAAMPSEPSARTSAPSARAPAPSARAPAPPARSPAQAMEDIDALLLDQVRKAIKENRIELYLQPVMALPQRRVRFYEALTRLRNETGEPMLPKDYLQVAEDSGAISAIDSVMLYKSVQVLRRLEKRSQARGLFCNISMQSLLDPDFFPEFVSFLDENRELSQNLFFEFGQAVIENAGPIELESLSVLASLGFRFSLDHVTNLDVDFRTLHDRGFRTVKLSSHIFPGLMAEAGARIHAADMRTYLERFGMRLIVEMIENENSLGAVIDHDVRLGQGYLFSEPRPVRPEVFGSQRESRAA